MYILQEIEKSGFFINSRKVKAWWLQLPSNQPTTCIYTLYISSLHSSSKSSSITEPKTIVMLFVYNLNCQEERAKRGWDEWGGPPLLSQTRFQMETKFIAHTHLMNIPKQQISYFIRRQQEKSETQVYRIKHLSTLLVSSPAAVRSR